MSCVTVRSSYARGAVNALCLAILFLTPLAASGKEAAASARGSSIDSDVVEMAFSAASCAVRSGAVEHPATLTVIDYSKPSTAKRMWVFDARTRELLYDELVAHGQGTGDNLARLFSNQPETHRSSVGLFVTGEAYTGRNGYSLRLDGLDRGFNDNARSRAIVIHGAPYVSDDFASAHGRLGRSWGCPAVGEEVARPLIDRIKGGGLVFAYYPDQEWLTTSKYVGGCPTH
jgi:hypothetical protein